MLYTMEDVTYLLLLQKEIFFNLKFESKSPYSIKRGNYDALSVDSKKQLELLEMTDA